MNLVIVCPTCEADIPTRPQPMVKVTCPACGQRLEVNMERENRR